MDTPARDVAPVFFTDPGGPEALTAWLAAQRAAHPVTWRTSRLLGILADYAATRPADIDA